MRKLMYAELKPLSVARSPYQELVDRNVELIRELERVNEVQEAVAREILGEGDIGFRLRAALTAQWLVRLYARRIGEARLLKEVEGLLRFRCSR